MLKTEAQGDAQNITADFLVLSVATAAEAEGLHALALASKGYILAAIFEISNDIA